MRHQHVDKFSGRRTFLALVVLTAIEFNLSRALVITNKMRYSKGNNQESRSLLPLDQTFEQVASTNHQNLYKAVHMPQRRKLMPHRTRLLDDEDRSLLEKFYRETEAGDPFLGDKLTVDGLWDDKESNGLSTLLDQQSRFNGESIKSDNDWTFEPDSQQYLTAQYSPALQLLTNYDPMKNNLEFANAAIVGATFYGQDNSAKPGVSSKSAHDAIKLHNSMLRQPPRDGIVRVRMYHHRAIHDEPHLYGNGPWKYWGHGWGIEFGFDPKSLQKDKNFYQKGYTIERAFGRDFCHKHRNCRPSDPHFFNDPLAIGKYSEKEFAQHKPNHKSAKYKYN